MRYHLVIRNLTSFWTCIFSPFHLLKLSVLEDERNWMLRMWLIYINLWNCVFFTIKMY